MSKKKTVLVIEDNKINRTMLSFFLKPDYEVLEAENGQDAMDLLRRRPEEISLIILDIAMPVMDGHEFLSSLRRDPAFTSLPVIVATESESEADEVNALARGANDFVSKPYRPQIILHRVRGLISLRENAAMANQFRFDRLTGLYTQEYFYQRVRDELTRDPEGEYDVVCSDVENFKFFNDLFGSSFGDRLLQAVAQGYQEQGGTGITARFHADQFVHLARRQGDYSAYFDYIDKTVSAAAQGRPVTIKWGVYQVEDKSLPVEQMCDRAQLAVRQVKGRYGRRSSVYDEALRSRLLRERAITDCMEAALAGGQFLVYFQPKYRLKGDRLCGAEALVRWKHPQWGFQRPDEFIPLFEHNGFITQLDQFVWERSCMHLAEWDRQGLPSFPVSVNVSREDIYNADLEKVLVGLVKKYGLEPSRLHLEITESAYTENPEQIIQVLSHLRALGFVIELDDFGSGYSSLSMINDLPMDIIKLDMRLVQNQTTQAENLGVLYFIMDLARWMDLEAVAEGVETAEQVQRLRDAGCDIVQGYYLSKPMPVEEFETLAAQKLTGDADSSGEGQQGERAVLLCADEDPKVRLLVRETFAPRYYVVDAPDRETALAAVGAHGDGIAAAIISLTLPGPEEPSLLRLLRRRGVPIIATAAENDPWEETALEEGAWDFLRRPYSAGSLRLRVMSAITNAELQSRESLLQQEACQDPLTGLLNRRGLWRAMEDLDREGSTFAVYMLDLDHLKWINDNNGHLEGDRHICRFARCLQSCTRHTDIVGRYGGDEFVVVLRRIDTEEQALRRGRALCRAAMEDHGEGSAPCTGGLALCHPGDKIEDMLSRADAALYRAKSGARGSCSL